MEDEEHEVLMSLYGFDLDPDNEEHYDPISEAA